MAAAAPTLVSKYSAGQKARVRHGRERRHQVSRAGLGEVHTHRRGFKPVDLLLASTEGRVPKLLPIKYGRMAASPFAFFRGAVSIMAADLALEPNTGLTVQLCGDAHLQNLGSFESPDGRIIFDINDFDETVAGPWEWDVKRMATSIVLAGFESNHRRSECAAAVEIFAEHYSRTLEELAEQPILVAARRQIHRTKKVEAVSSALQQAQRANPCDLRAKYTANGLRGRPHFHKVENVLWRVMGLQRQEVLKSLPLYRNSLAPDRSHFFDFFQPVDVAFKVVGTGSVGLRDYVVLMDGNGGGDPLFLQIKQEGASAYAPYLKLKACAHNGQRVVEGQRRIQPLSDLLLGWTRIGEHDYLVRQLNDHKGNIDLKDLRGEGLSGLAGIAGELLARGHARSGDALTIKGYIGSGDKVVKSIVHYGLEYAGITEMDFEQFKKAIREGRVKARA